MDSTTAPIAQPGTAGQKKSVFARIFSRHLMNIALLMMLPVIFAASFGPSCEVLRDPDLWWHLADARQLMTTHHFIWAEPNSFTVGGQPWVNPEWIAELPYWLGYQALHLRGIYLVTLLIIWANLIYLYWRGYLHSGHAGAAWWAAALGFLLISVNIGPRTIAIAYLAMSSEMAILEAYQRGCKPGLWLLPPLFCLWGNLHGSWLIGLALLVLYILCGSFTFIRGAIEQQAFTAPERNRFLLILGLCVIGLLINPYGWRLPWNPIDMMFNQKLNIANVTEWKPLDLSTVAGAAAFGAMCLMVIANALKGRRWRVFELAVVFFAWYAALDHLRFVFLAAVLTTPILARDIRRGFDLGSDQKTIPAANAVLAAAAAAVILYILPSEKLLEQKLGTFFPMQSISEIQPSWRTFNADHVGGMMTFKSKPEFIDSRLDIFEHRGILQDYLDVMNIVSPLEVFEKHRIDHVLVPESFPVAYLLKRTPGWTIVKQEKAGEDNYVTFARTPGSPAGSTLRETSTQPAGNSK